MRDPTTFESAIHRLDFHIERATAWLNNDEHPLAHLLATNASIDALRAASDAVKHIQSILASQGSVTAQMIRDARNGLPID